VAAACIVVATFAQAGQAQTAPTEPRPLGQGPTAPDGPQRPTRVTSPYWNQDASSSDLPAADIRNVPGARAAAVHAKWTYHQSMVDLSNAVRLMQLQMDSRPDFVAALTEEKSAYEAMQTARKNALAPLRDNAAYSAGEELGVAVSKQIEDERFEDKPDQARIDALAKLKLEYVKDNRKLEVAVLEGDQDYVSARQRYLDAGAKVRELRRQQSMSVLTDDTLIAMRRNVAESRVNSLVAAAYLRESIRARNIALDYAAFYETYNRQPYYTAGYWYANYGAYGYRY
jgi:hypothetical protein